MSRKKKWGCATVFVLLFVVVIIFGLHWAWKYYGLPELPSKRTPISRPTTRAA